MSHEQPRGFAAKRNARPDSRLSTRWTNNVVITPSADGASVTSDRMLVEQKPEDLRIRGMSFKMDELRKKDGRWCFHLRRSEPPPNVEPVARGN